MLELFFSAFMEVEIFGSYTSLLHFEPILNAVNLSDVAVEVGKVIRNIGFEHYLYGARICMGNGEPLQYIFSGYPEEWLQTYQAARYIEVDPIVEHCFLSGATTPLVWNDAIFNTAHRQELQEEAKGMGLCSGLSIPIRGTKGEVALLSAANSESNRRPQLHQVQMAGTLYVLSSYLHETIDRLVYTPDFNKVAPPRLTPRETECLTWWSFGKTAWEIGTILNLSERTVRFHLQNVKTKLGVHNKTQVIARAIKMRLINP